MLNLDVDRALIQENELMIKKLDNLIADTRCTHTDRIDALMLVKEEVIYRKMGLKAVLEMKEDLLSKATSIKLSKTEAADQLYKRMGPEERKQAELKAMRSPK